MRSTWLVDKARRNWPLLVILAFALAARLLTAMWLGDQMEEADPGGIYDQVSYDLLAHRVATGHGFTFPVDWYPWVEANTQTSYYSGTMVLHLAAIYRAFGYHPLVARILYAFLGTAICYFVYRLARRLFGYGPALVAAAIAAGYSYLILYSASLLTETPFIFFLILGLDTAYALVEKTNVKRWMLLGIALAGMILFRMAVLPFVVFLLGWLAVASSKWAERPKKWHLLIPIVIMIVAVLPWTIRNFRLYDRFMLLESQFGHVFWNSNHPDKGSTFGEVAWVAPIPEDLKALNEAELTVALLDLGVKNVLDDPARFFLLTLSRFKPFLTFWPTSDSSLISNLARVFSFAVSLPFMLYGLVLSRRQWRFLLPLYLFLVIHMGVYLVSWVMIRYRIPADTILMLFAGLAVFDVYSRLAARFGWLPIRTERR
jgi:4-amino-4-deoxy-L-arabinose transferase-like glycosyltransferase